MSDEAVLLEISPQGVATLTLNRPDVHNAFDEHMIALLSMRLDELAGNHNIRCVVVKGAGKSFSAGADLNWMKRAAGYNAAQNKADAQALASMLQKLYDLRCPTIALVHGAAIGGGFGLVACCDIVLAGPKAKFCLSEVKLGLIPATIGPFVMRAIGGRQMRRYAQTAEMIDVITAQEIGLVHERFDTDDDMLAGADILVRDHVLRNGPNAMAQAKTLCHDIEGQALDSALGEETAQRIADIRAGDEAREGLAAFLEKRAPHWVDEE